MFQAQSISRASELFPRAVHRSTLDAGRFILAQRAIGDAVAEHLHRDADARLAAIEFRRRAVFLLQFATQFVVTQCTVRLAVAQPRLGDAERLGGRVGALVLDGWMWRLSCFHN